MQPLPNDSKVWQTIPAGSLKKREPSKKHSKNKLSLVVTEVDEQKTSSYSETKKVKLFHTEIPNSKHNFLSSEPT